MDQAGGPGDRVISLNFRVGRPVFLVSILMTTISPTSKRLEHQRCVQEREPGMTDSSRGTATIKWSGSIFQLALKVDSRTRTARYSFVGVWLYASRMSWPVCFYAKCFQSTVMPCLIIGWITVKPDWLLQIGNAPWTRRKSLRKKLSIS